MMAEQMKILLETDKKAEAEEILRILDEMTKEEQQVMLAFMQGAKVMKEIEKKNTDGAKTA